MARFLIQSRASGKFLAGLDGDAPIWVADLREAGGGVLDDMDAVTALVVDHCDFDEFPFVIDLDRLGTFNDYPVFVSPGA
jgi:hypothetical protein